MTDVTTVTRGRENARSIALIIASALALIAFAWPIVVSPADQKWIDAAPLIVFAVMPTLVVAGMLLLDSRVSSAKTLALLGVLAAIGAAVRIASTGVGGFEAVFIVVILAGRAYGARFGFVLGVLTIAVSSALWGGFGPWTAFQMFAVAWVAAGAGLIPLPRPLAPGRRERRREVLTLAVYGVIASYGFGALMNLWFWPLAVGPETSISYLPGADLGTNLSRFAIYTLVTSTLTWDTVRAITTGVGIAVFGSATLASLRRARKHPTQGF